MISFMQLDLSQQNKKLSDLPIHFHFDMPCLYQALFKDNWGLRNSKLLSEKALSIKMEG